MMNRIASSLVYLWMILLFSTSGYLGKRVPFHSHFRKPILRGHITLNSANGGDDAISSGISKDGFVSAKAIITTSLVHEISTHLKASAVASAAMGRSITCALLMAAELSGQNDTVQLHFRGDGPLGHVLAIANGRLEAKAHVSNPQARLPPTSKGKIDVAGGVGKGDLSVIKSTYLPGVQQPFQYSSTSIIRSGEIATDLNMHLAESEQRLGGIGAGVHVDAQETVDAAGGWFVSLLPEAPPEVADALMRNVNEMPSPTAMLRNGMSSEDVVHMLLKGMEAVLFPRKSQSRAPKRATDCCSQDRALAAIKLLPSVEVEDLLRKQEKIEVKCEFCLTQRYFTKEALQSP